MRYEEGRTVAVSEWAGGYTKSFAQAVLEGAREYLERIYGRVTASYPVEEAEEAEEVVNAAETSRALTTPWAVIWEAFALVFVAELGDRTQFTTIFLATAPARVFTFAGLLAGTLLGHGLVTWLAVGAGKWIGQRVNERLLYRLSGGLFLVFGLAALRQALVG